MAPPQPYPPSSTYPDMTGSGSSTLLLQEAGDEMLWFETWRNDYTIVSATNTTPIVLTFAESIAGKIATGNTLTVKNVSGSSTVNGTWSSVTVTGTHTLSLDGSTAGGAGTGGRAYESSLGAFGKIIDALEFLRQTLGISPLDAYSGAATMTGFVKLLGRKVLARPRVILTDADHTIDVSQGDIFQLPDAPAAPRVITLKSSGAGTTPATGEMMTVVTNGSLKGVGKQYTIKREDTTTVAEFWPSAAEDIASAAQFDYDSEWKIGLNSGGGIAGGVVAG